MEIKLKEISVRDVAKGYVNDEENGVVGYDGKLNIRPKYQREFVYNEKQRNEVINSINNDFPLNVMYWICLLIQRHFIILPKLKRDIF